MGLPVRVSEIVGELEGATDFLRSFINSKTGEVFAFEVDLIQLADDDPPFEDSRDWTGDEIHAVYDILVSEDVVELPSQYDIHVWSIMERFGFSLDEEKKDRILSAIRGSGAFRRFKDELYDLELRDEWNVFYRSALEEIAVQFLEEHGIPYVRD